MDIKETEILRKRLQLLKKEFSCSATIMQKYLLNRGIKVSIQAINAFIRSDYERLNDSVLQGLIEFVKDKKNILEKL